MPDEMYNRPLLFIVRQEEGKYRNTGGYARPPLAIIYHIKTPQTCNTNQLLP